MITLKLTPEQVNVILLSLAEQPYKHSAPVIDEIQKQVQVQNGKKENTVNPQSND